MSDIGLTKAYSAPVALAVLMLATAGVLSAQTGVRPVGLFEPYLEGWAPVTFICLMASSGVAVARMAMNKVDQPIPELWAAIRAKLPMALLPGMVFPLFLAGYTWTKCSTPYVVGYRWDAFWTNADAAIFGTDPWQIAHAVMPATAAPFWSFFYAMIWGSALLFGGGLVFAFRNRRETAIFFTALMMAWLVGGSLLAYLLSAAGPIFAHLVDPTLAARYAPLHARLLALLGPDDVVLTTQRYLAGAFHHPYAIKGGGISAMPSMHIATATILLLQCWRTMLRPFALLFLAMTFFGSVYFGYHYALDAPVAMLVAIGCWWAASRYYGPARQRSQSSVGTPAILPG